MGLTKKPKGEAFKPKLTAQVSEDFNAGITSNNLNLTNLFTSSNEILILLYRENYYVNTNNVCTSKYVKGILKQSEDSYSFYSKIHLYQALRIAGTWIFENVYITGNAIVLQPGAKLILRNCYLYFTANASFNCIDATNGALRIEHTRVHIEPIGSAYIDVLFGSDVILKYSAIDRYKWGKSTGNLYAYDSYLGIDDGGTSLNGYNVKLEYSYIGGFNFSGTINLTALNSQLGKTLAYSGTREINGTINNCTLNSLILSNSNSNLKIYNSIIEKNSGDTSNGVLTMRGGNPVVSVFNSTLVNKISNQYILDCTNSNAIVKFVNCTFQSTLGRFYKSGSGTNYIRTVNCAGNKDITTDSGFNPGEIYDTAFVYDSGF